MLQNDFRDEDYEMYKNFNEMNIEPSLSSPRYNPKDEFQYSNRDFSSFLSEK